MFEFFILDAILSVLVSIYVLVHAIVHISSAFSIILEKSPKDFTLKQFEFDLEQIENVKSVHHIHIWTLDGEGLLATVHIVSKNNHSEIICKIKRLVKDVAKNYNINHITIQIDYEGENCENCEIDDLQDKHCQGHSHCHHNH